MHVSDVRMYPKNIPSFVLFVTTEPNRILSWKWERNELITKTKLHPFHFNRDQEFPSMDFIHFYFYLFYFLFFRLPTTPKKHFGCFLRSLSWKISQWIANIGNRVEEQGSLQWFFQFKNFIGSLSYQHTQFLTLFSVPSFLFERDLKNQTYKGSDAFKSIIFFPSLLDGGEFKLRHVFKKLVRSGG